MDRKRMILVAIFLLVAAFFVSSVIHFVKEKEQKNEILSKYNYDSWTAKEKNDLFEMINITNRSERVFAAHLDLMNYFVQVANGSLEYSDMQYAEILLKNDYRQWTQEEINDFAKLTKMTAESPNATKAYWALLINKYEKDKKIKGDK